MLVRTRDDAHLEKLQAAGATEVIPDTLEASLMVATHLLRLLDVPVRRIVRRIQDVRDNRYALMRSVFRGRDAMPIDETHAFREQLYSIELTEKAAAVGKRIQELALDDVDVTVTAVRRDGIVGKDPDPTMELRAGDFLVLYGIPEALAEAEERVVKG